MGSNPHVVAYGNGKCTHDSFVALFCTKGMSNCAEAGIGSDEDMMPDGDRSFIQYSQIEVTHEMVTDAYVYAKVAVERAVQNKVAAYFSENLLCKLWRSSRCEGGSALKRKHFSSHSDRTW